ncbi:MULTISPECIES: glucose-1-phosphate cytidylyltransferase [unclassified Dehalobacter]|uniref:glucose-1-phosphate cytidylyltransferase n=1 Tax=unclassified Dehalobacter TaxID=2635733 RepID=UPI0003A64405|nr:MULTISPECIES: glucose-1-phosphate cytidylyltransferase [unclassified Dehalobacter]TCX51875.1 glucose-1-phosphate cytidylyltransferase [Dehalobacter sp. 14DCB1]TCX52935.1 glucose-1-phosphate cytidylyltransferase [Dehalobacter sp. 12DCB1]
MKCVILAGGLGTRLSEETTIRPKPMVEIGGHPVLWHIMKIYSSYGINEFIICLGYKGYVIKEYFANYYLHQSDITFDLKNNEMHIHNNTSEPWKVTLIDTGQDTMTGGRLKRIRDYVGRETFCFTYGDGLCNVNIQELIQFHLEQRGKATLTAVNPPARYGMLEFSTNKNRIRKFKEKPEGEDSWINGGYFVLEPEIFDYISGDDIAWETEPLEELAKEKKLFAFKHDGFWLPMDTLRDKIRLEDLWNSGQAPWVTWQ